VGICNRVLILGIRSCTLHDLLIRINITVWPLSFTAKEKQKQSNGTVVEITILSFHKNYCLTFLGKLVLIIR
jgi:hypothetical protein